MLQSSHTTIPWTLLGKALGVRYLRPTREQLCSGNSDCNYLLQRWHSSSVLSTHLDINSLCHLANSFTSLPRAAIADWKPMPEGVTLVLSNSWTLLCQAVGNCIGQLVPADASPESVSRVLHYVFYCKGIQPPTLDLREW